MPSIAPWHSEINCSTSDSFGEAVEWGGQMVFPASLMFLFGCIGPNRDGNWGVGGADLSIIRLWNLSKLFIFETSAEQLEPIWVKLRGCIVAVNWEWAGGAAH